MENITVREIMVEHVVTVHPETSLLTAYDIIAKNKFDGVPVVDASGKLVGILTEYDFIMKSSFLHLPTFQKIFSQLKVYDGKSQLHEEIEALKKLTVADVMNTDPLTLSEHATLEETVAAFREHHRVNPVPVIREDHLLVGVVSRCDILKVFSMIYPVLHKT